MSATTDAIEEIIENAIEMSNSQAEAAANYAEQAITFAMGGSDAGLPQASWDPDAQEPFVIIPPLATNNPAGQFQSLYDQIKNDLVNQFAAFFDEYFPDFCAYLQYAEEWICRVLTDGGTGMNPSVEDQIWQRDRARILQEADRVEEEQLITWTGRGYPMPPGAAYWATLRMNQEAQEKISQASRDVAIKQAEIEIENIRFAVDQAIKLRIAAINAAVAYINALAQASDVGVKFSEMQTNAQAQLINAAANMYDARIRADELTLRLAITNATLQKDTAVADVQAFTINRESAAKTASAAAHGAASMAAAALNALHSQATLQSIENISS